MSRSLDERRLASVGPFRVAVGDDLASDSGDAREQSDAARLEDRLDRPEEGNLARARLAVAAAPGWSGARARLDRLDIRVPYEIEVGGPAGTSETCSCGSPREARRAMTLRDTRGLLAQC